MSRFLYGLVAGLVIATTFGVTFAKAASPRTEREYAKCIERLIDTRGLRFAIDHAGDTRCERNARKG